MWQATVLLSFLGKFLTVSIKILKNQGLSLTLGKATSSYGRLLCCLYAVCFAVSMMKVAFTNKARKNSLNMVP